MPPNNYSNILLSGQLEPNLIRLNEEHRNLVEGNYKIIYTKGSKRVC